MVWDLVLALFHSLAAVFHKLWAASPSSLKTLTSWLTGTFLFNNTMAQTRAAPPVTFVLPDLEKTFDSLPDDGLNPHHDEACAESRDWFAQYNKKVLGVQMQEFFKRCKFELITSYTYPYVDKEGLRATMDWHNILWFFDEVTDTETGKDAHKSAIVTIRTLREPDFDDGSSLHRMVKDFRLRHLSRAGPECTRRFLEHCDVAFHAGAVEAELREKGEVLSLEGYLKLRRETSGARTCFDMAEYLMDVDLPQYMYDDAVFQKGYIAALDLIFLANDLYSYNMEQAKGHNGANVLTVVMKETKLNLQSAADYVGVLCEKLIKQFQESKSALEERLAKEENPTKAAALKDAVRSLVGYGHWVRGNVEWSFETERYFGKKNQEIKKSRVVTLTIPNSVNRTLKA